MTTDKSKYDAGSVFWNMFLAYNVILHMSIFPINTFIIVKELSLEFY